MRSVAEKRWIFIRRYLIRVAIFALAAFIYSWTATHAVTTTYKAEAEIAFRLTKLPVRLVFLKLLANPLPIFLEDDIYSVTYDVASVISSDEVTNRVIERGNLKERLYDPEEYPIYREWFDDFRAHLMFDIHIHTKSMTIAYAAETPELAKEITQLYVEEFEDCFANLFWKYSTADAIGKVVKDRTDELGRIEQTIDDYLIARGKVAVRREAAQDVMDYFWAERSKMVSGAEVLAYDLALERVDEEMKKARRGEEFSPVREALFDYILTFAKVLYYKGNKRLTELEVQYSPEYPEIILWHKILPATEEFIRKHSMGIIQVAYNSLIMRSLNSRARHEFWTERAAELKLVVKGLPGFEQDLYGLMRKREYLKLTLWFWERRFEFHTLGEDLIDDPFIVLDPPVVPERAYYPILNTWIYAFPVLLMVGTLWFLLSYKLENECLDDIENGRL